MQFPDVVVLHMFVVRCPCVKVLIKVSGRCCCSGKTKKLGIEPVRDDHAWDIVLDEAKAVDEQMKVQRRTHAKLKKERYTTTTTTIQPFPLSSH